MSVHYEVQRIMCSSASIHAMLLELYHTLQILLLLFTKRLHSLGPHSLPIAANKK